MITPLFGSDLGIHSDENHVVLEWNDQSGHRVVFSASQKGDDAMECHFAPDSKSLRSVRSACEDFIDFVFDSCKWCKMLLVATNRRSVAGLVKKLGFSEIANSGGEILFMRTRQWA